MTSYKVVLTKTLDAVVYVNADDRDEASDLALELAEDLSDWDWEENVGIEVFEIEEELD